MLTDTEFRSRRRALVEKFPQLEIDALLIAGLTNVRYLTGFTGSNGFLLVTDGAATLFTDPRYTIQAKLETTCKVRIVKGQTLAGVVDAIDRLKPKVLGFERNATSYHVFAYVLEKSPLRTELRPTLDLVEGLRMIKSEAEVALIRAAVQTNSKAYAKAIAKAKAAMLESDLAAEIDFQMKRLGAEGPSFETIVASGARSALPHARPTRNPILPDQLLLIDMGATRDGYTSDMTRTVFTGHASASWRKAYRAVLDAQLAGIAAIRDGAKTAQVDAATRQVLKAHGLDKAFTHSTGHGLGLDIHESPRLGKKDKAVLRAGMVVTVEPGIYLEHEGGIRIEDTVLVTKTGCEVLTPTSKELTVI